MNIKNQIIALVAVLGTMGVLILLGFGILWVFKAVNKNK